MLSDFFDCFSFLNISFAGIPLYIWCGIVVFCSGLGILIKGNR